MGWSEMVDSKNLEHVCDYLQIHKDKIINTYNANGVGVGKINPNDEEHVIVVYLNSKQQVPTTPVILDSIRLKFEVTGDFTLHTK
jgi:hypothetical protein